MGNEYTTVVETVRAIQFLFDTITTTYLFLGQKDMTVTVRNKSLSAIITGTNEEKLPVNKTDYIVRDSKGVISVWKSNDFQRKFVPVESE